jgi:hypothetical protein
MQEKFLESGANDGGSIVFEVYEPSRLCAPDTRVNLGGGHSQRLGELPIGARLLAKRYELE